MLGVGRGSIRRLAADATGRLNVSALEVALNALGGRPALVIATAGEVNAGDFDPIADMAELAHRHHAWLQVSSRGASVCRCRWRLTWSCWHPSV